MRVVVVYIVVVHVIVMNIVMMYHNDFLNVMMVMMLNNDNFVIDMVIANFIGQDQLNAS